MNRIEEIEARLNAATPGPWKADTGVRGDCVVWGPNGRFLMNLQAEPHWLAYPGETRNVAFDVDKRDAEFIAGAREDVAYLLAELKSRDRDLRNLSEVYTIKASLLKNPREAAWCYAFAAELDALIEGAPQQ